jgi:hypothetical protein
MAVPFPAARQHDIMVGCAFHATIVPPAPVVYLSPHITGAKVHWVTDGGDLSPNVFANGRKIAHQFHDIGNLIPHVPMPPVWNILLLIIIPFSSSKIMMGSGTVLANGKPVGVAPVIQLNCGDPLSQPLAELIPLPPVNVFVGITLADLLMALAMTAFEMLISWVVNKIGGAIGKKVAGSIFNRTASRFTQVLYQRVTSRFQATVVARFSRIATTRVIAMAEREIGERIALSASREVLQQTTFFVSRQLTTDTVSAFYQRSVREAAAVVTDNFGVAVSREITETMFQGTTVQTFQQTASKAMEESLGKVFETILGQGIEPGMGQVEDFAGGVSSGQGTP